MRPAGEFNVEVRRPGGGWLRVDDPVVVCPGCGGSGKDPPDGPYPGSDNPCPYCRGRRFVREPLWTGLRWFPEDIVLDAEGGAREDLIAPPRGLPPDAARETLDAVAAALEQLPAGRPSWLTVRELLGFNWDHVVERSGWLPLSQYPAFLRDGIPPPWSTFSLDQLQAERDDYAYLSREEADRILEAMPQWIDGELLEGEEGAFVRVEWREPYRRVAEEFVTFLERRLRSLGGPDDVRIVFLA